MTINNQVLNLKARQILLKSGNGAQVSTYVGPVGEIILDTSLSTLRIHDGQTVGGVVVPTEEMVNDFANNYSKLYGNLYVTQAVTPYVGLFNNINVSIADLNSGLSNVIGNIANVDLRSLEAIWTSLNFDSNFANVVNTRINGVQANVIIEQTRASLAEAGLSASLATESQVRANSDAAINVSIALTNAALASEIAARSAADVVLTNMVANVQANLNAEATIRSLSDADLQANIDAEQSARIQGNIDLHNVLQANINAEQSARIQGNIDLHNVLQANINAEQSARVQGNIDLHNVLQANIITEQTARILEIASLHANITASNARIATLESTESFLVNSASTVDLVSSGNLMIPGHVLPKTHLQQDLGSASAAWRSLYLSASTMYLGNVGVSTDPATGLRVTGSSGEALPVSGNVKFPDGTTQTTAFLPVFISDLQANLLVERVERVGNIADLQTQINNILNNTSPGTLDSLAEVVVAYTQMDGNLLSSINTLSTGVYSTIGLEQSRAVAAETLLQANIIIESGTRSTQDLLLSIAIGNESNVRAAADVALTSSISSVNSNVDTLSTTVSTILSNINAVSSNLDIERSQRISNITALSTRIDSVLNNIDPQALDSLSELLTAFTQSDSTLLNLVTNVASVTNTAINSFRIELNAIISDLGVTDSNVSYANANIDTLTGRVTSLESNLSLVSNALASTDANVSAANSAISALSLRVTATESNIATLFGNADSQQTTINSLVSNAASQQTTIDSLVSNAASQQTTIDSLVSNAASQQTHIDNLWSNAASQQTTIDSLVSNAASQQTTIDSLVSNAASQQTTIDSLVSNAASQQTHIDNLWSNAASQQTHIDNLWSNAGSQYTAISSLDSNLATANAAIVILQGNVTNITTRVVDLESNVGQPLNATSSPTFAGLNLTNAAGSNIANYGIGYREVPQISFTTSSTAQTADSGKHYYSVSGSNLVLTLDTHANQPFIVGAVLSLINRGAGTITVTPASGVSLYLVGNSTSDSRSILSYGMATVMKVENDVWMINGTGVF
jgi:uncharacterized coiled-coil protein SlyX